MGNPEIVEMEVVADTYVEKHEYWETHRRSKNYIARLNGLHDKYGFDRDFLQRVKVGNRSYFKLEDFEIGALYELVSIYYTGSGKPRPNVKGIYKCISVNGKVVLKEIGEEEAIKHFTGQKEDEEKAFLLAQELVKLTGTRAPEMVVRALLGEGYEKGEIKSMFQCLEV